MRRVSLYDIDDVEAFIVMCIKRSGAPVKTYEYEDIKAEAICILYGMASKFIPQMEGYSQPGRFSGYAIKYMPRKIREAWHRIHEEAQLKTMPDGKREYVYYKQAVSYDRIIDDANSNPDAAYFDEGRLSVPGQFTSVPFTSK